MIRQLSFNNSAKQKAKNDKKKALLVIKKIKEDSNLLELIFFIEDKDKFKEILEEINNKADNDAIINFFKANKIENFIWKAELLAYITQKTNIENFKFHISHSGLNEWSLLN